ncbi:MAG: hypothetical protein R3C56_35220 [Pirellulaceae bacterium]
MPQLLLQNPCLASSDLITAIITVACHIITAIITVTGHIITDNITVTGRIITDTITDIEGTLVFTLVGNVVAYGRSSAAQPTGHLGCAIVGNGTSAQNNRLITMHRLPEIEVALRYCSVDPRIKPVTSLPPCPATCPGDHHRRRTRTAHGHLA